MWNNRSPSFNNSNYAKDSKQASFENRNPSNYFVEIEQAAFAPSNTVPGISFSPDKMLQARVFSYADAHRYRLGVNYELLPVNRPHATSVNNYQRDGCMRFDENVQNTPNYEPNSFGGPTANPSYKEPSLNISGDADRYNQPIVDDDYVQSGNLYRLMLSEEQDRLVRNIVGSLKKVPEPIQKCMITHFTKADPSYGDKVAKGIRSAWLECKRIPEKLTFSQ